MSSLILLIIEIANKLSSSDTMLQITSCCVSRSRLPCVLWNVQLKLELLTKFPGLNDENTSILGR